MTVAEFAGLEVDMEGYTFNQLLTVVDEDGCDKTKKIVIEVGGERVPLRHAYVVDQELIDEGGYEQSQLGTLFLDLDI